MQPLWTFKTRHFSVALVWDYEPDGDISWDETGEVAEKLDSVAWVNCLFRVQVIGPNGEELAVSYLGNSIHSDPDDFRKDVGGYFGDMVSEAVREARRVWNARPAVTLKAA